MLFEGKGGEVIASTIQGDPFNVPIKKKHMHFRLDPYFGHISGISQILHWQFVKLFF